MRLSLCVAALCVGVVAGSTAVAQGKLLAVSQRDQTFHVYDAATLNEIASGPESGNAGHEVIASRDGKLAYVPIYGDSGVGRAGSDGDHIDVFDIATAKRVDTIPFEHGVRPHDPVYLGNTGLLLVSTEIDKTVSIVDPKTKKIVGTIPTGSEQSHMITLLPDGKKLYSANVGPGTVSVMDVPGRKLLKVIPVSGNTQRIAHSNDGKWVFTADQTKPELVIIDTKTDEVSKRVPLPGIGYGTAPTVDGRYLLVSMDKAEEIAVVNLKTLEVVKHIATPRGINEIVVSPDGKWAYASSPKTNQVLKVDLGSWTVAKVVPSGKYVDGLWLVSGK